MIIWGVGEKDGWGKSDVWCDGEEEVDYRAKWEDGGGGAVESVREKGNLYGEVKGKKNKKTNIKKVGERESKAF